MDWRLSLIRLRVSKSKIFLRRKTFMPKAKIAKVLVASVVVPFAVLLNIAGAQEAVAMGPHGTQELDEANRSYVIGDFENGVRYAELHLRKLPNDGAAHYLKENCLMKLGRLAEAQREYLLVTKLAPDSVINDYSKAALKSIEKLPAEQRALLKGTTDSNSAIKINAGKVPPGTVELIRFQAARAKEQALRSGDTASRDEKLKADNQGKAQREAVERLSQSGGARGDHPPVSAAELQAMRERAAHNAEILKQVGEAKAARHEQESRAKSEELQRQAEDLERQLTDDNYNKNRDIKLNPVGTNLYVRNYSQIPPTVKPMRARAESLSGAATSQQTSAQLQSSAASGKLRMNATGQGVNALRREANVKGEVIPR
ncbi:MAG: hypothetical protein C0507_14400 [Cyanobacteria bacterium PR.3.49]|nr:hypothetical protein [Cyanobacteria bacterium PR.3.49]